MAQSPAIAQILRSSAQPLAQRQICDIDGLRGEPAGFQGDIWAAGVVLYEMITDGLPLGGQTTFEVISAILRDKPSPLPARVPLNLREIIPKSAITSPVPDTRRPLSGSPSGNRRPVQSRAPSGPFHSTGPWGGGRS